MLPLLSLRSLGQFLGSHAAFEPALRYPSDPGHHAMLHCKNHPSGAVMAIGHLDPWWNLVRKRAGGMAKVTPKYAAKQGKIGTSTIPGHAVGRFPKARRYLDGENSVGTYVN